METHITPAHSHGIVDLAVWTFCGESEVTRSNADGGVERLYVDERFLAIHNFPHHYTENLVRKNCSKFF